MVGGDWRTDVCASELGDVHRVRIGARTNLQDGVVVHVTTDRHPTIIGDDVTVGHMAVLHGCTVKERCLIGIGAIVLDGARWWGREPWSRPGRWCRPAP